MSDKFLLAVDCGSQSTKVSLIDTKGEVICSASEKLSPMINRHKGWVEHPGDDIWDSLKVALKKLFQKFQGDKDDILGMGLCSIRCCRVFLDENKELAEPIMSWMDVRAYETYEDDEKFRWTGSTSGYLNYKLTGVLKDTIANAFQYQFPTDMINWKWLPEGKDFDKYNIPREKLIDMDLPSKILGHVTEEVAKETGLPAGLPVVSTANDKAVEGLGCGLVKEGLGLLSLGTYITSMTVGKEYSEATDNMFPNLSCMPGKYLFESNGNRGGMWHISWFVNLLGETFRAFANSNDKIPEQLLEVEAKDVAAGSDGLLVVLDWLAPHTELHRKGVMIGFDQRHTRAHVYRAIMEAIAMTMKNNFFAMTEELNFTPDKLVVSGGGSNSALFMQIIADVFGINTVRNKMNGSAGLGAAICASVATGYYKTFEEAVENMVHEKDVFEFNPDNHATYSKINDEAYKKLSEMLEPTLKTIAKACN